MAEKQTISSDLDQARELEESIIANVEQHGFDEMEIFAIRLALEEGLINAIKHGNCYDCEKTVSVEWDVTAKHCEISIEDQGCGFVPDDVPDPTADENLERPGGRGLMLMKAYMDFVEYNDKGNVLKLRKDRCSE